MNDNRALNRGFGESLSKAFDFALMLVLFGAIGWFIDSELGTTPVFICGLALIGFIGQFARMWYAYDAEMRKHEAALPRRTAAPTDAQPGTNH